MSYLEDTFIGTAFEAIPNTTQRTPEQIRDAILKTAADLAKDHTDQRKPVMVVCGNGEMFDIRKWTVLCTMLDEAFHPKPPRIFTSTIPDLKG
jgi:hypothetical protein